MHEVEQSKFKINSSFFFFFFIGEISLTNINNVVTINMLKYDYWSKIYKDADKIHWRKTNCSNILC